DGNGSALSSCFGGEFDGKSGTFSWLAGDSHVAAHHLAKAFGERQTQAGAAVTARGGIISLSEGAKELGHLFGGHADAGVGDTKGNRRPASVGLRRGRPAKVRRRR